MARRWHLIKLLRKFPVWNGSHFFPDQQVNMHINFPNTLTLIRIALTPAFISYFLSPLPGDRLVAAVIFLLASLTDWYDGYLARKWNLTTRLGQFLDPIADKILISSALTLFAIRDYVYTWMVVVIVVRDILVTALRIYALHHGKPIITSTFAKWKTFAQMGYVLGMIIYLAVPGLPDIHLSHTRADYYSIPILSAGLVTLLTALSGVHYLVFNRSHFIEIFRRLTRPWLNP